MGFQHQLTDTTKVVDRFLVESNSDNTYMQNDLGLEVTITGSLGLRLAYQVRHNPMYSRAWRRPILLPPSD